jgi:hypothetical protein
MEFCYQAVLGFVTKKIPSKIKTPKEPSESRPKKITKGASGNKKTKKSRKLLLTNDDEMDEEAEVAAALKAVDENLEREKAEQ